MTWILLVVEVVEVVEVSNYIILYHMILLLLNLFEFVIALGGSS